MLVFLFSPQALTIFSPVRLDHKLDQIGGRSRITLTGRYWEFDGPLNEAR